MSEAVAIVFVVCVLPLAIVMHYITKWKATKGLTGAEEQMLESLWRDGQAMESRLNALETILDAEVPGWRKQT